LISTRYSSDVTLCSIELKNANWAKRLMKEYFDSKNENDEKQK
jgi:hypothetical protein